MTPGGRDDGRPGAARSNVREDSYYPDVGEPDIDALHYDLDLSWSTPTSRLSGVRHHRLPGAAHDLDLHHPRPRRTRWQSSLVRLDGEVSRRRDARRAGAGGRAADNPPRRLPSHAARSSTPAPRQRCRHRPPARHRGRRLAHDRDGRVVDHAGALRRATPGTPSTTTRRTRRTSTSGIDDPRTVDARRLGRRAGVRPRSHGDRRITSFQLSEPGRELPDHDRDRRLRAGDRHRAARPADHVLGAAPTETFLAPAAAEPELMRWLDRAGSAGTRSPPPASCWCRAAPAWRRRRPSRWAPAGARALPRRPAARVRAPVVRRHGDAARLADLWLNESFAMYLQIRVDGRRGADHHARTGGSATRDDQELRDENGPPGSYDKDDFASPTSTTAVP